MQKLTVAQFLLIAQTDLASIVYFGTDSGLLIQIVLGGDSKLGGVRARSPRQLDTSFQAIVASLINAATEFTTVVAEIKEKERFCFSVNHVIYVCANITDKNIENYSPRM